MKAKDLQLIAHLRQNARMSLTKMSKKTHIPVSTIFDRLKCNEGNVIVKHTTLLNFTKLGYHTRANITLKVERDDKEELAKYLMKQSRVNSLSRINNGYDFMIEGVFKQINEMEEFLDNLEKKFKIRDRKAYFIIEDLKREEFMSDPMFIA